MQHYYEVDLLFPVSIYKSNLDFSTEEFYQIEKKILNLDYFFYPIEGPEREKNLEHSKDQKILEDYSFKTVKQKIEKHLNTYLFDYLKIKKINLAHTCSWINRFNPGSPSRPNPHYHAFSTFSGVLYLNIPEGDCGNITFHKTEGYENLHTHTYKFDFVDYNIANSDNWSYVPSNNLIIIFPSHIKHSISTNNTNKPRYSLAFNYFVEGKFNYPGAGIDLKVM